MMFNPLAHFKDRFDLESEMYFPGRRSEREHLEMNLFVVADDVYFRSFSLITGLEYLIVRSDVEITLMNGEDKEFNYDYAVEIVLRDKGSGFLGMEVCLVRIRGPERLSEPVKLDLKVQPAMDFTNFRPVNLQFSVIRGEDGWCLVVDGWFGNDPGSRLGPFFRHDQLELRANVRNFCPPLVG